MDNDHAEIAGRIKFSAELQFWDKDGNLLGTGTAEREVSQEEFLNITKEKQS